MKNNSMILVTFAFTALTLNIGGCTTSSNLQSHTSVDCLWQRELSAATSQVQTLQSKRHTVQRQYLGAHHFIDESTGNTYRIEYVLDGSWVGLLEIHETPYWAVEHIDLRLTATSLQLDPNRSVWLEGQPIEIAIDQTQFQGRGCVVEFDVAIHSLQQRIGNKDALAHLTLPIDVFLYGDGSVDAHGYPDPSKKTSAAIDLEYRSGDIPLPVLRHTYSTGRGGIDGTWELKEGGWQRVDSAH